MTLGASQASQCDGAGTSVSRGAGRQNAGRESSTQQAPRDSAGQDSWQGSGQGSGQGGRQERTRSEGPRTAAWVQKAFETAQTLGQPTGELNDGWDEWSSLGGSTPDGPIVDGGFGHTAGEGNGSMQTAEQPAAAPPSSQEALLGTDVDIITGQRYSAAQVPHCQYISRAQVCTVTICRMQACVVILQHSFEGADPEQSRQLVMCALMLAD